MKVSYAIVFVSDMQRSVKFYRDLLGLPLKWESPKWTEFATSGCTLALHVSNDPQVRPEDPKNTPAGRCKLGLSVPDIQNFHQKMLAQKVPCLRAPYDEHGVMLAQYTDPDGMGFSIAEEKN